MPACAACGLYYTPSSLRADGTCPHCMQVVDWKRAERAQRVAMGEEPDPVAVAEGDETAPIPWHFKLLLGAAVLYLGFRAWEGIVWVAGRF